MIHGCPARRAPAPRAVRHGYSGLGGPGPKSWWSRAESDLDLALSGQGRAGNLNLPCQARHSEIPSRNLNHYPGVVAPRPWAGPGWQLTRRLRRPSQPGSPVRLAARIAPAVVWLLVPIDSDLDFSVMGKEHDCAVNNTADDAAGAKWSASQLGYFNDPFIRWFSGHDFKGIIWNWTCALFTENSVSANQFNDLL